MQSPILLGAILGVYPNAVPPEYILVILLIVLLAVASYGTVKKGFKLHNEEQKRGDEGEQKRGARNSAQGVNKVDDDVPLVEYVDEDVQACRRERTQMRGAAVSMDVQRCSADTRAN